MEMNTPTPPGDRKFLYFITIMPDTKIMSCNNQTNKLWLIILVLLVAVGSYYWTEAHDMNKALNRTCELEVLPDYPLSSGNSIIGLSFPAGGLVSGRPFFCGGKSGETLRTECYILRGADNKTWELVANLKTARWQHAGVSFGDSLWVTGSYVTLMLGLFMII